jgi:hypothetical protein
MIVRPGITAWRRVRRDCTRHASTRRSRLDPRWSEPRGRVLDTFGRRSLMWRDVLYRMRALIRRDHAEQELDDELRLHVEQQIAAYREAGLSADETTRPRGWARGHGARRRHRSIASCDPVGCGSHAPFGLVDAAVYRKQSAADGGHVDFATGIPRVCSTPARSERHSRSACRQSALIS